jgi:hypothetical protein
MKSTFIAIALFSIYFILGCTKESGTVGNMPAPQGSPVGNYGMYGHSNARYAGSDYSQSIPVTDANQMIQSYLTSVNYPAADTALRSLSFDADTLRAYLQNSNIVTLKFMLAHQPAYASGTTTKGVYAGQNPNAMTLVVVGLNEQDQYVLNNRNGVYEHFIPCPNRCTGNGDAFIQ